MALVWKLKLRLLTFVWIISVFVAGSSCQQPVSDTKTNDAIEPKPNQEMPKQQEAAAAPDAVAPKIDPTKTQDVSVAQVQPLNNSQTKAEDSANKGESGQHKNEEVAPAQPIDDGSHLHEINDKDTNYKKRIFQTDDTIPDSFKTGFYFFLALSTSAVIFIVVKVYRLRLSRAERKYGVQGDRSTQELTPLPISIEDGNSDDDDQTLFEVNRQQIRIL